MFVDEGFGSLDPESLSQSFRALADLKEKIDKQIIITKDKTSVSKIRIVV